MVSRDGVLKPWLPISSNLPVMPESLHISLSTGTFSNIAFKISAAPEFDLSSVFSALLLLASQSPTH